MGHAFNILLHGPPLNAYALRGEAHLEMADLDDKHTAVPAHSTCFTRKKHVSGEECVISISILKLVAKGLINLALSSIYVLPILQCCNTYRDE